MTVSATCAIDEISLHSAATDTYDYDAFGNKINSTGSTPNDFLYRGEELDPDLGLYYLRARYYNPATGRFMSRDPEDGKFKEPSTLHKYLYAAGDPVNRIDPRGREDLVERPLITGVLEGPTVDELLRFGGVVGCAFGFDAYVISLLNGGNAMDATLGGVGLAAGWGNPGT